MPTARKLPSGSWRCQVFSHNEPVFDANNAPIIDKETGKQKQKRIYKSFTSDNPTSRGKKEAELEATKFAISKKDSSKIENITLDKAMGKYIDDRSSVLSPATVREYKRTHRSYLKNIVSKPIGEITQDEIQKEINDLSANLSPKTVRNVHGFLSIVLKTYRPGFALRTKLPKKKRPKLHVPSDDEVKKIMEYVADTEMEVPILFAAFGPMRRGEICALDASCIKGNIVHVQKNMVLDSDNKWRIKEPKTYAGDRLISFPDFVIAKITVKKGRVVNLFPSHVTNRFTDILERLEIPHFRFHDLRHYSASIQHAIGVPDAYIMERGGWENDAVLKNVYRHVLEEKAKEMNQKTNDYFTKLRNTECNTK